ncbi:HSP20-like chaperone [Desarmillaria tabescens]|uniref:HSP20-like chaperone n=1 Tax=Armillaria tabescens TaxID=1929756 RepID=A0AA39NRC9_ARMTA|nr:HSP20-like chaperone [Desarmillaria tabescens]KAK0470270.1 HSP20-like chaperone [Desarmillaria tabescens]
MDVHENIATNIVTAILELPGLDRDDIHIDWHDGWIRTWAEIPERDASGFTVCERNVGMVSRKLRAPRGIKEEDIKASLKNGLLTLTFPRAPETVPKRIVIS